VVSCMGMGGLWGEVWGRGGGGGECIHVERRSDRVNSSSSPSW